MIRTEGFIGFAVCMLMSIINIPFIFIPKFNTMSLMNITAAVICFGLAIANLIIAKE